MKNGWIEKNGDKRHYLNDLLHNDYGPAIIYSNGDKCWYQYDELHRENGPAVEWDDTNEWWYKGVFIDCSSQENFQKLIKLLAFM